MLVALLGAGAPCQVQAVVVDDVMARPDAPELSCVLEYETRSLR